MSILQYIPETLPAYGEKYRVGGGDLYREASYVKIFCRDYEGAVTYLKGYGKEPIEISFNFADSGYFKLVAGSSCSLNIVAEDYDQLFEFAEADDTTYYIEVWEDVNTVKVLLFSGYLRPETYTQQYGSRICHVQITATDGLGMLKFRKFKPVETGPLVSDQILSDLISYLLYLAGNRDDWYDMVPWRDAASDLRRFTGSCSIPLFDYFEEDCYTVLTYILGIFNMQICKVQGKYAVRLVDDPNTSFMDRYNYQGVFQQTIPIVREEIDAYAKITGIVGEIRAERPLKSINFVITKQPYSNLLYNGDLAKEDEGWYLSPDFIKGHFLVENKEMVILYHPFGTPEPHPHVMSNFGRGFKDFASVATIRVEFETKHMPRDTFGYAEDAEWTFKIALNDSVRTVTVTGPDWNRVSEDIVLSTINGEAILKIFSNVGTTTEYSYGGQVFKNIKVFAVRIFSLNEYQALEQDEEEIEIEINTGSLEDRDIPINYHSSSNQGDVYRYQNVINMSLIKQETSEVVKPYAQALMDRYQIFHEQSRMRISITGVKNEDLIIKPQMILFDKYLKRFFTILQYSYQVIGKWLSLECMELEEYIEDNPSIPYDDWILVTAFWDDTGVWRDNKYWIDSL